MPGVDVTTTVRKGPASGTIVDGVTYFVSGLTERGPIDKAVKIASMADYGKTFGDRTAYSTLYDDVRTHFEEGGTQVAIARVVGDGASAGTLALMDTNAVPAATLNVNASSVGPWSTRVSVAVIAGSTADTFTLVVYLDGAEKERFRNLKSPADAVSRVVSKYITVADAGSVSVAPANNPAVIAATPLTAGVDNRASLTADDYVAALARFNDAFGSGIVAIPSFAADQVGAGVLAHCQANQRIGITSVAAGSTPDEAKAAATTLIALGGGEYMGLAFPAIKIPNDLGSGTLTIGPEGYVAACRARAVSSVGGPWQAPAGALAAAKFVSDVDYQVDRATGEDLDAAQVSAIRVIGDNVRLYGWRSLADAEDMADYPLLSVRDLLNFVQVKAVKALEAFVFISVDAAGQQLKRMQGVLVGILDPIAQKNGVYPQYDSTGTQVDPGYTVDVGSDVNTIDSLVQQKLGAIVALRPSPTATLIELNIVKAALTASL